MIGSDCPHTFFRSFSPDAPCPMCKPVESVGACSHDWLREFNGGLCPICHEAFIKLGLTKAELLDEVDAELRTRKAQACRASLATFFRESWHVLEPATPLDNSWHFDVLASHMEAVFFNWMRLKKQGVKSDTVANELQNLLVNVPPGTAKSRFVSVCFVAWAWLHDPTMSVLALSVNPNVAKRDADLMRALIESDWYRETFKPNWTLRADKHAVGYFQIEKKNGQRLGWRRSFGIGGVIIGERSDLLLVDDAHDPNDAVKRDTAAMQAVVARFDNSLYNRVNHPALSFRMIVGQRVHMQDISGHVLGKPNQKWIPLVIPLTRKATQIHNVIGWHDPRREGDVMMPTRFTEAVVEDAKETYVGGLYEALYEQDPPEFGGSVFKGEEFKWFRFADDHPSTAARPKGANHDPAIVIEKDIYGRWFEYMAISVDANFAQTSAKAKGSDVGLEVWGIKGKHRYLVDDLTAPLGFNETVDAIRAAMAAYPEITKVIVENKANGPAIMSQLADLVAELVEIEPEGSKEGRAWAVTSQVRAGNVLLRDGQSWLQKFCAQVFSFPVTPDRKNDRVDAMTQILNYAKTNNYAERYAALAAM